MDGGGGGSYTFYSQQLELSDPSMRLMSEGTDEYLKQWINTESQKHFSNSYDWNSQTNLVQNTFSSSLNNSLSQLASVDPGTVMPQQLHELQALSQKCEDGQEEYSQEYDQATAVCSPELSQDLFPCSPDVETESQRLSQLSVIDSQDENNMPAIFPWTGKYNFSFSLEKGTTKKFSYSTARNKLFCQPNLDIEFLFKYDFEKCAHAEMCLRGFLRYSSAECAPTPVARCMNHVHEDRQAAGRDDELAYHVMKCTNVGRHKEFLAEHYRDSQTARCYVTVPVGKLQPGAGSISKMFRFDCLNSCRDKVLKKAATTVVFELLKNGKVVGRIAFELRVCSCPGRDFAKEEPEENNGLPKMKKKKSKNCDASTSNETVEVLPFSEKKGSRQGGVIAHSTRDEHDSLVSVAKKRRIEKTEPTIPLPESQDSFVTSSQESVDENDSRSSLARKKKLRDYYKMTKFILSLSYSSEEFLRLLSETFGRHIVDAYLTAVKASKIVKQSSATTSEGAKDPDSGVGPGQE